MKKPWTKAEDRIMRQLYPHKMTSEVAAELGRSVPSVYNRSFFLGLYKTEAALSEFGRRLDGTKIVGHRFKKGHKTWNAGMKGWQAGGRAKQTQFKKGSKPQTWVPVGTERTDSQGYLKRKVSDTGNRRKDWKFVHVILWEKLRGPIPPRKFLVFKNRNNGDIRLMNLMLVDRAENAKRNTIYRYPPELVKTIKTLAKLRRKIDEKRDTRPAKSSVRDNRGAAGR